jgi:predicted nuclease with TOPRIM domain
MGKGNKERLEDLRANNAQLQEENQHLKEKVQMFNQRMEEMEKNLETSTKLFPLLKKNLMNAKTPSHVSWKIGTST